uniref:Uncharacterized protein n=1 Tax=Fagus sylvatica TaxID=28930 RepID=A0A2N9G9I9_FAGSY
MTPATSWNSRFAESIPRLIGIFTGRECTKTAPIPRLPGAITPSSELRFVQTLYRWKEDVESFPTICRMTHFEFQKTSKTAPENRIKKGTRTENRGGFETGCWRGRTCTAWQQPQLAQDRHAPRMMVRARRARFSIKPSPPPPHLHIVFARALGLLELSLGRK